MAKVHVKFPKTGLGNLMLVWANALIFSKINELPLYTGKWWGVRLGPFLRMERKKRIYRRYFNETRFTGRVGMLMQQLTTKKIHNPALQILAKNDKKANVIYLFDKPVTHEELFLQLGPYQAEIKHSLYQLLTKEKLRQLETYPVPVIAVHIRRGDFKLSHLVTPLEYFSSAIKMVRNALGTDCPVTVFSDADENELKEIFLLPNVALAVEKPDILDILVMSKSKIIITSKSSSFSYWAAFLSEALVIIPATDWQTRIKADSGDYIELRWEPNETKLESLVCAVIKKIPSS